MSFLVIGIYWARSHFLGKILEKTDHTYNLLNLLFLASVSWIPIPTDIFVHHLQDSNSTSAAMIYSLALLTPALVWTTKWWYSVKYELLDPRLRDSYLSHGFKLYFATSGGLILAAVVTSVAWKTGITLAAVCTLFYLLPPKDPEYKPGQAPANELEEAEDRPRE